MKIHLTALAIINSVTFALAWRNSTEEELPGFLFFIETVVGAIASGVIATIVFALVSRYQRKVNYVFGTTAYMTSIFGLVVYAIYATNGKADSLHSAAHMHVIAFPMLHGFLTIIALGVASVISVILYLVFRRSRNTCVQL